MELFSGQSAVTCDGGPHDHRSSWFWFQCTVNGDKGLNFEDFRSTLVSLFQTFATADVSMFLNSTALLPYGRSIACYWACFYIVLNIIIFNVFSCSIIDMSSILPRFLRNIHSIALIP